MLAEDAIDNELRQEQRRKSEGEIYYAEESGAPSSAQLILCVTHRSHQRTMASGEAGDIDSEIYKHEPGFDSINLGIE
jgi:hypothetical protein